MKFDRGALSVHAGCNTLAGSYRIEGGRLLADQLGGTEIGCDAARHAQDDWLARIVASKPAIVFSGDTIFLSSDGTTLQLRDQELVEPDTPLVATTWVVDTIIEGDTASSAAAAGRATIFFPSAIRIEVYDGCNRASGAIEIADDAVRIIDLPAPVHGNCPAGTQLNYTKVLAGRVRFEIDADRLMLTNGAGRGFGLHAK
jgi:heat shock protein HslJ